jgi:hypothetical protein
VYLLFRVGLGNLGLRVELHRHNREFSQLWGLLVYLCDEYCAEMVEHTADYSQGSSAKVSGILETITGCMAQGAPRMYRIVKCVMVSFGLDCVLTGAVFWFPVVRSLSSLINNYRGGPSSWRLGGRG